MVPLAQIHQVGLQVEQQVNKIGNILGGGGGGGGGPSLVLPYLQASSSNSKPPANFPAAELPTLKSNRKFQMKPTSNYSLLGASCY